MIQFDEHSFWKGVEITNLKAIGYFWNGGLFWCRLLGGLSQWSRKVHLAQLGESVKSAVDAVCFSGMRYVEFFFFATWWILKMVSCVKIRVLEGNIYRFSNVIFIGGNRLPGCLCSLWCQQWWQIESRGGVLTCDMVLRLFTGENSGFFRRILVGLCMFVPYLQSQISSSRKSCGCFQK